MKDETVNRFGEATRREPWREVSAPRPRPHGAGPRPCVPPRGSQGPQGSRVSRAGRAMGAGGPAQDRPPTVLTAGPV